MTKGTVLVLKGAVSRNLETNMEQKVLHCLQAPYRFKQHIDKLYWLRSSAKNSRL